MKKFLLVFFCCLGGDIVFGDIDWCALDCKGEKNTLCQYQPQTNSQECKNIKTATTPTMRKDILHKHNEYRNKMANGEIVGNGVAWPKGSDMREMSWDYNLEKLALRWAQQCFKNPPHDKCRRTPEFEVNGQNKGWAGTSYGFPSPYGSFDRWVNEIELVTPAIVDRLWNADGALHFTQVIWAESYKLGCAAIHAEQDGYRTTTTLVCNYGPGGNYIGEKIYFRGDPCKACPAGTSCSSDSTYPQLCALPTDPKKPKDIPEPGGLKSTTSVSSTNGKNIYSKNTCKPCSCNSSSSKLRLFGMQPENTKILVSSPSVIITSLMIEITFPSTPPYSLHMILPFSIILHHTYIYFASQIS